MEILDPRDFKTYKIEHLKVVYHDIPNKRGKMVNTKCVEYTVIGRRHEWGFWMTYKDFVKANPEIPLK